MKQNLLITFLLVCVLEGVFVSALKCPSTGISMSLEDDKNYLEPKYPNVDTYGLCGTFCSRTEECKFWTWYSKGSNSKKYNDLDCLLFDSDDQLTQTDGATSGDKTCPEDIELEPACGKCSPEPVRFSAKNLTQITFDDGQDKNYLEEIDGVGDSSLCGSLCAITTPCIYWTWYKSKVGNRDAHSCLMFDNIVQLQFNEYAISGEKNYPDINPEDSCPLVEDICNDPCVVDPEPGPHNAGNAVQFGDKGAMKALGIAFYVAVMAVIRM